MPKKDYKCQLEVTKKEVKLLTLNVMQLNFLPRLTEDLAEQLKNSLHFQGMNLLKVFRGTKLEILNHLRHRQPLVKHNQTVNQKEHLLLWRKN